MIIHNEIERTIKRGYTQEKRGTTTRTVSETSYRAGRGWVEWDLERVRVCVLQGDVGCDARAGAECDDGYCRVQRAWYGSNNMPREPC